MTDKPRAEPKRRSIAQALVKHSDPSKIVAWYCQHCGRVYKDKEDAERCPKKECTYWECETCGLECSAFQWYCSSCLETNRWVRELEKLSRAEAIRAEDYPNDRGVVYEDKWYPCLDDFIDAHEHDDSGLPVRVWATEPSEFQLTMDDVLYEPFQRWLDDVQGILESDIRGVKELAAAVEAFNAKQILTIDWQSNKAVDLAKIKKELEEHER